MNPAAPVMRMRSSGQMMKSAGSVGPIMRCSRLISGVLNASISVKSQACVMPEQSRLAKREAGPARLWRGNGETGCDTKTPCSAENLAFRQEAVFVLVDRMRLNFDREFGSQ